MWRRLVRFNVANGGVSLVGGAMLMALLVDAIGLHYLAANLVTVLACSVANYLASDRWVFGDTKCVGKSIKGFEKLFGVSSADVHGAGSHRSDPKTGDAAFKDLRDAGGVAAAEVDAREGLGSGAACRGLGGCATRDVLMCR
jgi:hypothetical protein